MLKPIIFPYKMSSKSARLLRDNLDTFMMYPDRNYRPKADHLIINWGYSQRPNWLNLESFDRISILNYPYAVAIAAHKTETLCNLPEEVCPVYWTNKQDIPENTPVFCRTKLTSRGGDGIVIASNRDELVDAPLYTKAYTVQNEYRVHCTASQIIDVVQKKRMSSALCEERGIERNELIRNHDNGWVFARQDITPPQALLDAAMSAVASLRLDFGAVDIATTIHNEKPIVVFEINTAPGLEAEGTTIQKYLEYFRSLL